MPFPMDAQYAHLLPAPDTTPSQSQPHNVSNQAIVPAQVGNAHIIASRRSLIAVACEMCHRRKLKCDGQRPRCARCLKNQLGCVYRANEGETRTLALKRKYHAVEQERDQLKQLFDSLRYRPQNEAYEILHRIRASSGDPVNVLAYIKHTELLLPSIGLSTALWLPEFTKLDAESLTNSPIKVTAKPWTTVARDSLVSELISSFFARDAIYFFANIEQEAFLADMKDNNPRAAKYCSPLLVNAICAHQSFFSGHAMIVGHRTGSSFVDQFLDEAKRQLDLERGKASLPTAQACMLMFVCQSCLGKDRAGTMFRFFGLEMIKRLDLESRFRKIKGNSAQHIREREILSAAAWGFFSLENRVSLFYALPSILSAPNIPQLFSSDLKSSAFPDGPLQNVDLFGRPYNESVGHQPQTPGITHANCDLNLLFYEVMVHNAKSGVCVQEDLANRRALYLRLMKWSQDLPDFFRVEINMTPQTSYLKLHINEVAYTILQPVHPGSKFPCFSTDIKTLMLAHIKSDIEVLESHLKFWRQDNSPIRHSFLILSNLVPFLNDPTTHILFTRASYLISLFLPYIPLTRFMMIGIEALAWRAKQVIPASARPYFDDLSREPENFEDLPLTFVLPQQEDLQALLEDDVDGGIENGKNQIGNQLGAIIARWSAITIR